MPKTMWERAANAQGYSSAAEYIRCMISAGESNIAALDPSNSNREHHSSREGNINPEKLLLEALDEEYKDLNTILENAFQEYASNRLYELAQNDESPIQKNGFDFKINERK